MQAIIIIAHNNYEQVIRLSKVLNEKFEIYIHFDKKLVLTEENKLELKTNKIKWLQVRKVHWGAWSIVESIIAMLKEVMKNPEIHYVHIISGQDRPARKVEEIYNFYEKNPNIYMRYDTAKNIKKSGELIENWQKFYYNYDTIDRRTTFGKIYHRFLYHIQKILHVNKLKKYNVDFELFQGSMWADMPMPVFKYCLDYLDNNPNLKKVFQTSFCPDEFWMQTILCNSKYKDQIICDNHRFIKWVKQYGSYPAILDINNYDEILEGDYTFIRKVNLNYSQQLIENLMDR